MKKVFSIVLQNLQENTGVSFLMKFFYRTPPVAASDSCYEEGFSGTFRNLPEKIFKEN